MDLSELVRLLSDLPNRIPAVRGRKVEMFAVGIGGGDGLCDLEAWLTMPKHKPLLTNRAMVGYIRKGVDMSAMAHRLTVEELEKVLRGELTPEFVFDDETPPQKKGVPC